MKRQHRVLALFAAAALVLAACGDDDDDTDTGSGDTSTEQDGPAVKVAAQDFGESKILAEIYAGALKAKGFDASTVSVNGNREILFGAFESGDVNMAPDYVASELNYLADAPEATSDVDESLDKLQPLLEAKGIVAFEASSAVDTNVFVMMKDKAEEAGIASLSDLAEKGADLKLGAPQDCSTNAFCLVGLKETYDVDLASNFVPLDPSLVVSSLEGGAVDVGVMFSTDSRLSDDKYLVLEDDKGMFAADNVVPIAAKDLADAYGAELADVLNAVSAELDTETLIELNKKYDVDREDAEDIANDWLSEHNFT